MSEADRIISLLKLLPHPEGGHFRETFRDGDPLQGRAFSTAIYYLLRSGERSHWHRVDAAEVWHWYAGDSLEISISADCKNVSRFRLGPDLEHGERPQIVVPVNQWQSATPLGRFTLVGCTVAPAFEFEGFEMAPPAWNPANEQP
ncbi:MAG: cupin domain-containing protein [Micropepsaceae bacterium]